jgi:hypothetical protein
MFPFIFQGFKLIERENQGYFDLGILKETFCGDEVCAARSNVLCQDLD